MLPPTLDRSIWIDVHTEPRVTVSEAALALSSIRVVVRGVLVYRAHFLACEAVHPADGDTFYVPLGGGIEFGERAADAVVREFREELDREVAVERLLGVLENIFEVGGELGHEIVFEYAVAFAPGHEPPNLEALDACESDGSHFVARWLPVGEVVDGVHRVYPDGLRERLKGWLEAGLLAGSTLR
jgi:ADP-ribose pyrophosphatase YjhB (NUDIX family)